MITNYAVFSGAVSKELCDKIVSIGYMYPEQEGTTQATKDFKVDKTLRTSSIRWINALKHLELNTLLEGYVNSVNRDRLGFDISYGPESYQYTEYHGTVNGHYGWHIDCLYDNNAIVDRKITICIHLSKPEDFEGGKFCLDTCVTPKFDPESMSPQGSVLVFPSYIKHCVTPITKGTRKSLVVWYGGPRYR